MGGSGSCYAGIYTRDPVHSRILVLQEESTVHLTPSLRILTQFRGRVQRLVWPSNRQGGCKPFASFHRRLWTFLLVLLPLSKATIVVQVPGGSASSCSTEEHPQYFFSSKRYPGALYKKDEQGAPSLLLPQIDLGWLVRWNYHVNPGFL